MMRSQDAIGCEGREVDLPAEEALLRRWEPVLRHLACRFAAAADREDLEQIARLALLRAARRFGPSRGCKFSTYAFPTILGELLHYLRDRTPAVRIPRRWWDLRPRLTQLSEALAQALGRQPMVSEIAGRLGVSEEDVAGTLGAHNWLHPLSLEEIRASATGEETEALAERVGATDPLLAAVELQILVRQALRELPARLRHVVQRRYFRQRMQMEVSRELGLSQMQISRMERQALARLRSQLNGAWGVRTENTCQPRVRAGVIVTAAKLSLPSKAKWRPRSTRS
jgi:RNA polymerase sigma-B factor